MACHLVSIVLGVLGLRFLVFSGVLPAISIFSLGDGMIFFGLLLAAAFLLTAVLAALGWLIARICSVRFSGPALFAVPLMDSLMLITLLTAAYLMQL